jgi:hypothetical protein
LRKEVRVTEIRFAPKEVIEQQVCRIEILDAYTADTYGFQVAYKVKVVGGPNEGHTFTDYASRDEHTGEIKQGSKAWAIFEACLGRDFYKKPGVSLESMIGKQFIARVTQTRTGSRNKIEFGTIGPVPPEGKSPASAPDDSDRVDFSNIAT